MRTIKKIHPAQFSLMGDLTTYSPLPSRSLEQIDPFLLLNHHGPQQYKPGNRGLPFGPHPHRGMETVTFIIDGDIMHKDSAGHESVIEASGIQWMTAGKGLLHSEISSAAFKKNGGSLEILQLWLNLPARLKMTEPKYIGLQKESIPAIRENGAEIRLISGEWNGQQGAFNSLTGVFLSTVYFQSGAQISINVPENRNILFYVIRGSLQVNGKATKMCDLVEFNNEGQQLQITADSESILLFGHAQPFNEPVVAQGPFVMNTEQEIREAYRDYQLGKFGVWKE